MTFIVTGSCIQCKYTDCVEVCPMDCFLEGPNFLVINPEQCIDCSICVGQCPVSAIVSADEVNDAQKLYVSLNAELARNPAWKRITRKKEPMIDHERYKNMKDKIQFLMR